MDESKELIIIPIVLLFIYRVLLIRSPRVIDRAKKKNPPIEALGLLLRVGLLLPPPHCYCGKMVST
jgi:hypothetical protein